MTTSPQEELEILIPDRDITLTTGETVTVREFRFYESLKLEPTAMPIIQSFADIGEDWETIDINRLLSVFSSHAEEFTQLLAASVNREVDWVKGLSDKDGTILSTTFWSVNQSFFVRRLLALLVPKMRNRQAENHSDGDPSSPHSSPTAMQKSS
ncbi:DUF6631 family protein [Sedimenticola selenatireducens]|uniref:DUF6631 family protein n=1 Tax=Sedimenticola selenatireducens TaxID=191960 RepID=UPI0004B4DB42|nr:DUF6631 family protein [Sedimenticola selenatireducens]